MITSFKIYGTDGVGGLEGDTGGDGGDGESVAPSLSDLGYTGTDSLDFEVAGGRGGNGGNGDHGGHGGNGGNGGDATARVDSFTFIAPAGLTVVAQAIGGLGGSGGSAGGTPGDNGHGSGSITNNAITVTSNFGAVRFTAYGVDATDGGTAVVSGNRIDMTQVAGAGNAILEAQAGSQLVGTATVAGNTIHGSSTAGMGAYIGVTGITLAVTGNDVVMGAGDDTVGISINGYETPGETVNVSGNTFDGGGGFNIFRFTPDTSFIGTSGIVIDLPNHLLTVNGQSNAISNFQSVDIADVADAPVTFIGDASTASFTGGYGNDVIQLGNSTLITLAGGPGTDTLILGGDVTLAITSHDFNAASIQIENIGGGRQSYAFNGTAGANYLDFSGFTLTDKVPGTTGGSLVDDLSVSPSIGVTVNGMGGDDIITGTAANDTLDGGAGNDTLTGGTGNDTLNGSDDNDTLIAGAGADTVLGGLGIDNAFFATSDLTSADTVNGGADASLDRLTFTTAGTVGKSAFTNVSHIEQIYLADGTNHVLLTDALVGSADDAKLLTIFGGTGDDTINASAVTTAANHVTFNSGSGNDNLIGSAGADTFNFAIADLSNLDKINGGTGAALDRLTFTTAGTVGKSAFTNVSHIEQIYLADGTNHVLLTDALVGSADDAKLLTIFGGTGDDTINASAVTTAANHVTFNSGSGNDNLIGSAGADTFNFADLSNLDKINGGTGAALDRLTFTTAGWVEKSAFTNVSHIEQIYLADGTNHVLLTDALVGSADDGKLLTIFGGTGDDTISASAVTTAANHVTFNSGSGNDNLIGSAGADTFNFAIAHLSNLDKINGGTGAALDRLTFTTAGTVGKSAFTNVSHIERIYLADGTNHVLLTDALVGSADDNHLLKIIASNGNDTIDASAVTTAANRVTIISGGGNDTLTGGAGADNFIGGAGADLLTGNGGADHFIYTAASESSSTNYDTLAGIDFSADRIDITHAVSAIDAALSVGTLSTASFDTDLATALTGHLNAFDAMLFTASAGTLSGQTFLIVDLNGTAGYQANGDLVFHITGQAGTLATTDFI